MTKCRACGKDITFLLTIKGKTIPVDAETVKEGDTVFDILKHRAHFASCPEAGKFRRKKK